MTEAIVHPVLEQTTQDLELNDEAFIEYVNRFLTVHLGKDSSGLTVERVNGKLRVRNTSYAGVLQHGGHRLVLSPKVQANILYMLTYLEHRDALKVDFDAMIDVEQGDCFFEALAKVFSNELSEILQKGLLKRYVPIEENRGFLKGKLLIGQHLRRNLSYKPKIFCSYYDLTFDNLENRIVLRALNLLVPRVRYNQGLKVELLKMQRTLLGSVELDMGIGPSDCDRVCMDRLSERYGPILNLAELVLKESFVRSTDRGSSKGFNFLVDMNKLYEDFLTEIVRQVVAGRYGGKYKVVDQRRFRTLDREGKVETRPDVLMQRTPMDEYPIILDAKYKRGQSNADVYQMVAYSLAIPNAEVCCLVYPETEGVEEQVLHIKRNVILGDEAFPLVIRKLKLFDIEGEGYGQFIKRAKEQVHSMLEDLLSLSRREKANDES